MSAQRKQSHSLSISTSILDKSLQIIRENTQHAIPSYNNIRSITKLDDFYFMNEIDDYVDDGIKNLTTIIRLLFPGDFYDSECSGDPHSAECETWTHYRNNIERYIPQYNRTQINKNKRTSFQVPASPQILLGYETPSESSKRLSAYLAKRASQLTLLPLPHGTPQPTPEQHNNDHISEYPTDPNCNQPGMCSIFYPGLMQAQTSVASQADAEVLSDPDDENVIYILPSFKRDDSDHFRKNKMKLECQNNACCSKKPIYRCSYSSGIYGSYTVGYSHVSVSRSTCTTMAEQKQIDIDAEQCSVDKIHQLLAFCEPLKRIRAFLNKYQDKQSVDEYLYNDEYGVQQLFNDFMHIKTVHIDADNEKMRYCCNFDVENEQIYNIARDLCHCFENEIKCNIGSCDGLSRRNDDSERKLSDDECIEDKVFQMECDKIHVYFLHSLIKYCECDAMNQDAMDTYSRYMTNRISSKRFSLPYAEGNISEDTKPETPASETKEDYLNNSPAPKNHYLYLGAKEDNVWWQDVRTEGLEQSDDTVHDILVKKMGVFRWQNPHGFMIGHQQEIGHYKQKYNNVKEEVLHNQYTPLATEDWNSTLTKANIVFNSFLRQKMKTTKRGFYEDQITQQSQMWDAGVVINRKEIMALKLYTDFDKLQFALKKCFRYETFEDILIQNDDSKSDDDSDERLKHRLESFYNWRTTLLITLNKFGVKLNGDNNKVLYHGVNAKMIIKATQTFAFSGPLSTTSSFHVARTFATAKGMVLTLTTQFPRLNYCNAFDASLISEYPEEQEWLVASLYARLMKVSARTLCKSDAHTLVELRRQVPLSSWARQIFFVVHLFDQQILSMSDDLEKMLQAFLRVNRKECCGGNNQYNGYLCSALCQIAHQFVEEKNDINGEEEWKQRKILKISWEKFEEFRKKPNYKQHVRFDAMGEGIKCFFMEPREDIHIETNKRYWSASFDKIITVYPGIKEIRFMNEYKLDNFVLRNLIKSLKCDKQNEIRKISFLYHNYTHDNNNKPWSHRAFEDPDSLDKELMDQLKNMGWNMKHKKNGETGYKIRIYRNIDAI